MAESYKLPTGLAPRLDLHVPPVDPRRAEHYRELVDLLEELGSALSLPVTEQHLRRWERSVLRLLEDGEIDEFMRPAGEVYDPESAAAHRWQNLKRLLLRRKGLDRKAETADG